MLNWIKNALTRGSKHQPQLSEKLIETATIYIQLVKSRIIEGLVNDEAKLLSADAKTEQQPLLMPALCAYFAARTDYELENRKVSQKIRDQIWSEIIEAVFEEMDISNQVASIMHPLILQQMGLVRGVIETKGATDYEAVATILTVMSSVNNQVSSQKPDGEPNINPIRVNILMQKYEGYSSYLNTIAAESQNKEPDLRREHDAWINEQENSSPAEQYGDTAFGDIHREHCGDKPAGADNPEDPVRSGDPGPKPLSLDQEYEVFKRKLPYYLMNGGAIAALILIFWAVGQ